MDFDINVKDSDSFAFLSFLYALNTGLNQVCLRMKRYLNKNLV